MIITHTPEEVDLMMSHFAGGIYKGVPRWIFMAALNEWNIDSVLLLRTANGGHPQKDKPS